MSQVLFKRPLKIVYISFPIWFVKNGKNVHRFIYNVPIKFYNLLSKFRMNVKVVIPQHWERGGGVNNGQSNAVFFDVFNIFCKENCNAFFHNKISQKLHGKQKTKQLEIFYHVYAKNFKPEFP